MRYLSRVEFDQLVAKVRAGSIARNPSIESVFPDLEAIGIQIRMAELTLCSPQVFLSPKKFLFECVELLDQMRADYASLATSGAHLMQLAEQAYQP